MYLSLENTLNKKKPLGKGSNALLVYFNFKKGDLIIEQNVLILVNSKHNSFDVIRVSSLKL